MSPNIGEPKLCACGNPTCPETKTLLSEAGYLRLRKMLLNLVTMARDGNPKLSLAVIDLAAAEGLLVCHCDLIGADPSDECVFNAPCPEGFTTRERAQARDSERGV